MFDPGKTNNHAVGNCPCVGLFSSAVTFTSLSVFMSVCHSPAPVSCLEVTGAEAIGLSASDLCDELITGTNHSWEAVGELLSVVSLTHEH